MARSCERGLCGACGEKVHVVLSVRALLFKKAVYTFKKNEFRGSVWRLNAFLWRHVRRACIEPTPKRATS